MRDAAARRADIFIFTDGSGINNGIGAAADVCKNGQKVASRLYHMGKACQHTVYEAELLGMYLGLDAAFRMDLEASGSIALGVDSQAAIRATQLSSSTPGSYLTDMIHHLVSEANRRRDNWDLTVYWVPGHEGVAENEGIDEAAKDAAKGQSSQEALLPESLGG